MRRIMSRLRSFHWHRWHGEEDRGVMGFSKLLFLDIRFLGAITVALVTLFTLSNSEPPLELAPSQIAHGEPGARIFSFAISPSSSQIASANYDGRVTLRAPENGWQIERVLDFPGFASDVAFSPDGRFVAAVGLAPGVCLWDLRSPRKEPTKIMMVPIQQLRAIAFSPDSQSLAVTSFIDGTILVYEMATWRDRMVFHQRSPAAKIAFSPDGRWLATAESMNRSILVWDLHSGSPRLLQEGLPGGVTVALAFSPDGAHLASAGFFEHYVRLWDLETGRVCRVLASHERSVNSVAFSADGLLMATAGNDGIVGLWTVATGVRRLSLNSHAMCLRTLAFSPDGRALFLATADDDDVRLWDLAELLRAYPGSDTPR